MKNQIIFGQTNIKFFRLIGIILILIYLLETLYCLVLYKANQLMFSFKDYDITYEFFDMALLLVGLVTMLIAEVLSKALKLKKEEQDLTV